MNTKIDFIIILSRIFCIIRVLVIILHLPSLCNGAIITNINFIFDTFSPNSLVKFFEFSDKEWNINETCIKDMYHYLEGLQKGLVWAIKLYDSTGYYGGSAFGGHKFRTSNLQQCKKLQFEYLRLFRTHWSLRTNLTTVPFPVQLISAKYEIELATNYFEPYAVQQTICFPKSCEYDDLKEILMANFFHSNHILKNMTLINFRIIQDETRTYNIFEDSKFFVLVTMIIFALILPICTHFSDYLEFLINRHQSTNQANTPDKDIDSSKENSDESIPPSISIYSCCGSSSSGSSDFTNQLNNTLNCAVINKCIQLNTSTSMICNIGTNDTDRRIEFMHKEINNALTNLKMHPLTNCMTFNNIYSNNHVNLVKIQKIIDMKNAAATISLDILAGNCDYAKSFPKSTAATDKTNFIREILEAFSLNKNFKNLINRSTDQYEISSVQGFQFICSILMILINTCTAMEFISNSEILKSKNVDDFLNFNKKFSTYLMDTFFFLCGAKLTHFYFKTNRKNSLIIVEQLLHFIEMVAHKICSIILPYIVLMISWELLSKYFYLNSVIEIPSVDYRTCETMKWKNILFIDTFFPVDQRCMPWSWFISLEMQFFITACVVLLLAQIQQKYAGIICIGLFMTCVMGSIFIEMEKPAKGLLLLSKTFDQELADFNLIFDTAWLRIPPYLLGMCLGYILYKTNGKFQMNIFIIIFGWIACSLIVIGFIFGFQVVQLRLNPWLKATIITLAHTIWGIVLFWIILASITQYGGLLTKILHSDCFQIFGKLWNCILLLNPLIIRISILSGENGGYLSNIHIIITFLGFTVLTLIFSFLLYLLFEAPLMALLQMIYKHRKYHWKKVTK